MLDKEDNFDEFLRQKVEESHFEYDEAHWLKAEKLIANAEPKRKTFWLGFGIGVLSLSLLGGLSAVMIHNLKKEDTAASISSPLQPTNHTASEQSNSGAISPKKQSTSLLQTAGNQAQTTSKKSESALVSTNKLADSNTMKAMIAIIEEFGGNEVYNLSQKQQINVGEGKATSPTTQQDLNNQAGNELVEPEQNNSLAGNAASIEKQEETIIIAAPIVIDSRPKELKNKDIDVNIATACEKSNQHDWMFHVIAGVSDSRGFEGNTASDSRIGFGYFGGCRLAYKLDKNWFLGAQPLVYSRGAINTSIETEKNDYAFGVQADEFVVKNKSLLLFEMPVTIGYRVLRHQISAGAGFEYLVNVKSDVKEFGTSSYKSNQWGYTDGFNRVGAIATFNYAFNMYQEFWISLMIQKGFTDFTKAGYFTNNSIDKNSNLRIGVQYQFSNQKKKQK